MVNACYGLPATVGMFVDYSEGSLPVFLPRAMASMDAYAVNRNAGFWISSNLTSRIEQKLGKAACVKANDHAC